MLELYCERARLEDGQRILDLGCGWGSLTLYLSERFPNSTIVALSNSRTQAQFIEARLAERGASNVRLITANAAEQLRGGRIQLFRPDHPVADLHRES